ncbi:MAG TPA: DcaP family trimeric outer membrane transporter, partial [Candidatus Cybelea sp.]|nr:DcaP family trimeric outer membrane transporter [Candidatus Cybelea sp.]
QINSDRTAFALRHAYGTLGPLLAGQYFSLFEDLAAAPETLDFGGAIAVAGPLRLPQIRYVYDMGHGLTLAGSAENPQTVMVNAHPTDHGAASNVQPVLGSSTFGLGQGDKIPDFVGAVIFSQGPGHIAFRGVLRDLYAHNPTTANITNSALAAPNGTGFANQNASTLGWGAGISGDYHVFGKDDILGEINGGYGIGRYITNTGNTQADSIQSSAGNTLTAVPAWAANLGYQHWWTDNLRSTLEGSVIFQNWQNSAFAITGANAATIAAMNSNVGQFGSLTHRELSTHVNLIWSPVPAIDLGYEFIWEQRKIEAGNSGQLVRSQISTKFKF